MSDEKKDPAKQELEQAVKMAIAATERGDYAGALKVFKMVYGDDDFTAPPDGLSHYGLCIALAEKQTLKGIEYCKKAITMQFYDSTHHANLVRLLLKKGNRKSAVEVLESALQKLPDDDKLIKMRREMGYRQKKAIPILPRNSKANEVLGKRHRGQGNVGEASESSFDFEGLSMSSPLVMGFIGLFAFAIIFGLTFALLYKNAYG